MANLFHIIIYQPLVNALIFLYQTVGFHDLGIAIIALTILIRVILYPLYQKSAKQQTVMQHIQPKLKNIQEKHKGDRQRQADAMMALYKEHNLNPFSGIFFLIIQLPILIALYQVFLNAFSPEIFTDLYSFIPPPSQLNEVFLGLINLKNKSILIVLLAAIAQFFQAKLALPKNAGQTQSGKQAKMMAYIGPVITIAIFSQLPSAIGLYWLATSVISIAQQIVINKQLHENGELGEIHSTTG